MRIIAYCRVSTQEQAASGLGLEAQVKRVRAYAELYELTLVDTVVDAGLSAKTLDREGLARVLAMLDNGQAEGVLVAKLDRLTRSVRDLGELVDRYFHDHALISVAENVDTRSAAGRLVLNVLGSVAQWEREIIGERTSAALQAKKARGERAGNTPYGYRAAEDGRLERDAREQAIVDRVRELRARGAKLRDIATELAADGVVGRTGQPLRIPQLSIMARRSA